MTDTISAYRRAQHPYASDKLNSHYQHQNTVTPAMISA